MLKKWCDIIWIYVMFAIGGVTAVFLVFRWHEWSAAMRLCAVNAVILPFHVLEEWILPGGFHYAYNMNQKVFDEKLLHQYPMSKLTDMITNFLGIGFYRICFLSYRTSYCFRSDDF